MLCCDSVTVKNKNYFSFALYKLRPKRCKHVFNPPVCFASAVIRFAVYCCAKRVLLHGKTRSLAWQNVVFCCYTPVRGNNIGCDASVCEDG